MIPCSLHHLLKQRLDAGEWLPGQRMPSIRKLTAAVDFSYHDVVSAYAQLVSEGVLTASPGRGYFVANRARQTSVIHEPECMAGDPLFRLLQGGQHFTKLGSGWLPPRGATPNCWPRQFVARRGWSKARWQSTATSRGTCPCANSCACT